MASNDKRQEEAEVQAAEASVAGGTGDTAASGSTASAATSGAPRASGSERGSSGEGVSASASGMLSDLSLPSDDWDKADEKQKSGVSSRLPIEEVEGEMDEPVDRDQPPEAEVAELEGQSSAAETKSKKIGKSKAESEEESQAVDDAEKRKSKVAKSGKKDVSTQPSDGSVTPGDEKSSVAKAKGKKSKKSEKSGAESEEEPQAEDEAGKKKPPAAKKKADDDTAKQPGKEKSAPEGEPPAAKAGGEKSVKDKGSADRAKGGDQSKSADGKPDDPSKPKDPKKQATQLESRQTIGAKAGDGTQSGKATPDSESKASSTTSKRRARKTGTQISIKAAAPDSGGGGQISRFGRKRAGRKGAADVPAANPASVGSRSLSVGLAAASQKSDTQPLVRPPSASRLGSVASSSGSRGLSVGLAAASQKSDTQPLVRSPSAAESGSAAPLVAARKATTGAPNRILIPKFATKESGEFRPTESGDWGGSSGLVVREEFPRPSQPRAMLRKLPPTVGAPVGRSMAPRQLGTPQEPTRASSPSLPKVVSFSSANTPAGQKSLPGVKADASVGNRALAGLSRKQKLQQSFNAKNAEPGRPGAATQRSATSSSPAQSFRERSSQTNPLALTRRLSDKAKGVNGKGRVNGRRMPPNDAVDLRLPSQPLDIPVRRNLPLDMRKAPAIEEDEVPYGIRMEREFRRHAVGVGH
jgi:hypothetical protein